MAEHGVRRSVTVSGAGVPVPGDVKGAGARFVSALTLRLARDLVEDKQGGHEVLVASGLDWTAVRPPRLVDEDSTGRWSLVNTGPDLTARPVTRADVALALLSLASIREYVGR